MTALEGIEEIYELTSLQQGMLFHSLYAPDSPAYTIQLDFALEGALDRAALAAAWRGVIERHAPLRTSFVWERVDKPYQVVHRYAELELVQHDLTALAPAARTERHQAILAEDRARLFDLTRAPLMRLALIAISDRETRFAWTFHHIILEGWSAAIVLAEVWRLYAALAAKRAGDLPPPARFADYIGWLRARDHGAAEAYWRRTLAGFAGPTHLPIDRSTGDEPAGVRTVDSRTVTLPSDLCERLRAFARSERVTLNTVVQGLWAILLGRYAGEPDVVFGAVVSGRPAELSGAQSMVGLFVNTLPARVKLPSDRPLGEWLRELQLAQAAMREYEYSALAEVQSWSDVPGGRPLFHSVLAFENWLGDLPAGEVAPGLAIRDSVTHEASDQPLTLFAVIGRELALTLMYDVERFEAVAIERMLGHCRQLLEAMIANPGAALGALDCVTPGERQRLLVEWNATATGYPRDRSIKALFEAQAAGTPDAVAVEYGAERLTYAELDARSNRLAHHLARLGVVPGTRVALASERSLEMVVGILGIVKAGGAYVPLDPEYPSERLAFMLEDTGAPVLVAQAALIERLPAYAARIVRLDADRDDIARESAAPLPVVLGPESLAYVMYTSGSTGRPKGACVVHRNVVRLVKDATYMRFGPDETFLQFSPISFDAATLELWGSLLNGGRLVVCPAGPQSLEDLGRIVRERGVTALWLTSALFHQMVNEELASLAGVRQILSGGDVLSVTHVREVLAALGPEGVLLNCYGPTENTTFTTCHAMRPGDAIGHTVPIGRPISNTRVYVLDERMRPVPVGVAGELYAGGDGVAQGYLNLPELTGERFVPDPFSADPGARLYRTGDRVRWREDGAIEFLGRVDFQVKIRGFRIEPGEIETALARHPGVREAIVLAREDEPGDRRLAAYLVAEGDPPAAQDLRSHLRASLPEYMVPASFMWLAAFPITPNGKVDRARLPRPDTGREAQTAAYTAPATELEARIAAAWCEVLRLDRVGADDNFFDLGGNSLSLIKVHGRLAPSIEGGLKLVELFRFPTVRRLASHLSAGAVAGPEGLDRIRERANRRREALRRPPRT